jgi:hypothetical protein
MLLKLRSKTLPSYVSSLTTIAVPCATRFGLYLRLQVRYECRKPAFGVGLRRKAAATPKVYCNAASCSRPMFALQKTAGKAGAIHRVSKSEIYG